MTDSELPLARHEPVTTLADLLELDEAELVSGHLGAERDDPEPGLNHTRAYHHGWRTRNMDLGRIETTEAHRALTRAWMAHSRGRETVR